MYVDNIFLIFEMLRQDDLEFENSWMTDLYLNPMMMIIMQTKKLHESLSSGTLSKSN